MQKQPLLSIIIPTRNRIPYAISAINTILSIKSDTLELVVQDNSDFCELKDYVRENIFDDRLVYNYESIPLSFVDNFNQAILLATGEYLCLIGDDDGINPEILDAVLWAKNNDISAIKPGLQAQYLWPGANISSIATKVRGSTLTLAHFSGKIQEHDANEELLKLLREGGQKYYKNNLPKLYHGIVKRECMERIRELTGKYVGGLTPDIYIVVALATIVDKVIAIDYPLTIPGACVGSGSIDSVTGKHTGKLEEAPHFRGHDHYTWAEEVPRFYSVETIWADSVVAALNDLKRPDILRYFYIEKLAAFCLTKYPAFYSEILNGMYRALRLKGLNPMLGTLNLIRAVLSGPVADFFSRVINKVRLKLFGKSSVRFEEVNDIVEATDTLIDHLKVNGLSFRKIVAYNEQLEVGNKKEGRG
ncbi:glycosyltransferase [Paenibacillus flagellatus]|uniref:Glycosyltransferase 2-like domain-containing protein n=1 Tax=Paenibacillus flagellatus TaxID=2211139 RepID=A0A2V5KFR2_9BACL|nr:glycosyltransferase [Paenibacillus flagellatus]PYI52940.1 hypothetical protein DLM86_18205 [Paenibacillus flagellatus]